MVRPYLLNIKPVIKQNINGLSREKIMSHLLKNGNFPLDSDMNKWRLRLAYKLHEAKVPVLDLYEEIKSAELGFSGELYYYRDSHWTVKGNQVVANAITKRLNTLLK